jgi:ABC-type lipoprotein export system ATPase subunit
MLELVNLSHSYDKKNLVLDDISFKFDSKKYVLIGPSGVGKSTLLNIAGGLLDPYKGFVRSDYDSAFIFQLFNLLDDFTIRENIEIAPKIKKKKVAYNEVVEITGISHLLDKFPGEISVGEKQRAAIARALACNPDFIFADEPTGSLDPYNASIIRNIFDQINKSLSIGFLISTHDYNWLSFADEKLNLKDGKICLLP